MICDKYQRYELEEITEDEFQKHLSACSSCRKQVESDQQLMALAKSLHQPVAAPRLWQKIEDRLRAEQQKTKGIQFNYSTIFRIAAVLIVTVGITLFFIDRKENVRTKLLADSALERVEEKEQQYEAAIARLENLAVPQMAQLDLDMMFLYKEKLATIDEQIGHCKEALKDNPANAHIRRYLLAALVDKKETLKELVNLNKIGM